MQNMPHPSNLLLAERSQEGRRTPLMRSITRSAYFKLTLSLGIGLSALFCEVAHAQSTPTPVTLGVGIAAAPRYQGASDYHITPFPLVYASHSLFFVDGLSVGAAVPFGQYLKAGVLIAAVFGRDETDEARLNGLGNIATSAALGGFLSWTSGPFDASAKYLQSAHTGYGATLTLAAKYKLKLTARDQLSIGEDAVWSNASESQTYLGVTDIQARNSAAGLPAYAVGAGFHRVDTTLTLTHALNRAWSVDGVLTASNLLGNAAKSPIVERSMSVFAGVGVAYTF